MFTVEKERGNATVITTLDEASEHEDLEVYIESDGVVFIRQFSEELQEHQLCIISASQLLDVVTALDAAPGIYRTKIVKESTR
jgi:hypothetical protein